MNDECNTVHNVTKMFIFYKIQILWFSFKLSRLQLICSPFDDTKLILQKGLIIVIFLLTSYLLDLKKKNGIKKLSQTVFIVNNY